MAPQLKPFPPMVPCIATAQRGDTGAVCADGQEQAPVGAQQHKQQPPAATAAAAAAAAAATAEGVPGPPRSGGAAQPLQAAARVANGNGAGASDTGAHAQPRCTTAVSGILAAGSDRRMQRPGSADAAAAAAAGGAAAGPGSSGGHGPGMRHAQSAAAGTDGNAPSRLDRPAGKMQTARRVSSWGG